MADGEENTVADEANTKEEETRDNNALKEDDEKKEEEKEKENKLEGKVEEDKNEEKKKEEEENGTTIVLTLSEEKLGIKITKPNQEALESMERLYAVPSEKLRVWACWLLMIGNEAKEWQNWLRSYIGLAVRLSDLLQKAVDALEKEERRKAEEEVEGKQEREEREVGVVEFGLEEKNEEGPQENAEALATEEVAKDEETSLVPGGESPVELVEASAENPTKLTAENDEVTTANVPDAKETSPAGEPVEFKESFWPIGTRWEPKKYKKTKQRELKMQRVKVIPIPTNEEDMLRVIKEIRHQTVLYRSQYKHWLQTGVQAVKEIVGRTVMPTEMVYVNDEDVPYFFYLKSDPDIDYAIEHDDEEIFLPDPTREKISSSFEHLYFNIDDKPGKGGKP